MDYVFTWHFIAKQTVFIWVDLKDGFEEGPVSELPRGDFDIYLDLKAHGGECCALPVPYNLWAVDDLDASRAQMLCGHNGGDQ